MKPRFLIPPEGERIRQQHHDELLALAREFQGFLEMAGALAMILLCLALFFGGD